MMIIIWITNISFNSPQLEWASWTHKTLYIVKKIKRLIRRSNCILDILLTEYFQQPIINSAKSYTLCIQWLWAMIYFKISSILENVQPLNFQPFNCTNVIRNTDIVSELLLTWYIYFILYPCFNLAHEQKSTADKVTKLLISFEWNIHEINSISLEYT